MKTLLWVLGGLFILQRLNGQGLNLFATVSYPASPFGTAPAGGGAAVITPANDPYANINLGGAGGGGLGTPGEMSNTGFSHSTAHVSISTSTNLSRISRGFSIIP